ncbi:MAG: hypothetical protein CL868_03725 [Cytophagaceae bacterium]|nr:hypothetical protein [Cytophagaceae bacterium]|tara:strand:- start:1948 stop:2664 length:717 start_codon:yes stop_codon:yes gene_type:complete
MGIQHLILLQLIAHLLADYSFQSKKMANSKDKKGFRSKKLLWHVLIVFLCHAILGFSIGFVPFAFAIAILHFLIDGLKPKLLKSKHTAKYAFFIDQLLHAVVFVGFSYLFISIMPYEPIVVLSLFSLKVFTAFLFCTKPANIFIREIFNTYDISFDGKKDEDLPNAGRLIGIVERWLVLIFIIVGQFAAVGFLIGAKSILRFKDSDHLKTEYVLVGTLLSFGFAVFIGVALEGISFLY